MNPEVKKLEDDYVAKGGTKEEFHKKRNKIMKRAEEVSKMNNSANDKEIAELEKKGYTRADAHMKVSAANIAALESRGFGERK